MAESLDRGRKGNGRGRERPLAVCLLSGSRFGRSIEIVSIALNDEQVRALALQDAAEKNAVVYGRCITWMKALLVLGR